MIKTSVIFGSVVGAGIVVILLVGCSGSKMDSLWQDASFSPSQIKESGLAFGGVAWGVDDRENEATYRMALDNLLWRRLKEDMKKWNLRPPSFVGSMIGEVERTGLVNSIKHGGVIDPAGCDLLREKFNDSAVFILFGSINKHALIRGQSEAEGDTLNKITRRVSGEFQLYDAAAGRLVWRSEITAWKMNMQMIPEETGFIDGLVHDIVWGEDPEYPDAPDLKSVIWKLYGNLTETLRQMK